MLGVVPHFAVVGDTQVRGAAHAGLPRQGKHQDDQDVGQHHREFVGELDAANLDGELKGLGEAEQQGTTHDAQGAPATESTPGHGDEPPACHQIVREHLGLAEREVGASQPSQGAAEHQGLVAHPVHVDAHAVRGPGCGAHGPDLQPPGRLEEEYQLAGTIRKAT